MKRTASFLVAAAFSSVFGSPAFGQTSTDFVESTFVFPTSAVIDRFDVVVDAAPAVASTPVAVAGGVKLRHPLAALTVGSHAVFARACNSSGCGSQSPTLSFVIGPGIVNFTGTLIITN